MLSKNDIVNLTIDGVASDGSGVGHADGLAVFVPLGLIDDVVDVRILKVTKSAAFGKIERLITPSPDRIKPDCDIFGLCGGCVYRSLDYSAELEYKRSKIVAAYTRIAGVNIQVPPVLGCDEPNRYRNKLLLPVGVDIDGKPQLGFYARRSHRIVPCGDCLLQPEEFTGIAGFVFDYLISRGVPAYDEIMCKGLLRHIYIRKAAVTGETMVCVVINGDSLPYGRDFAAAVTERFPQVKTVLFNINRGQDNIILGSKCVILSGDGYITDVLRGVRLRISPLSFYQINHAQTERLYDIAEQFAGFDGSELLLDLYCGAGSIGLSMAGRVRKVVGVEIIPEAIADARRNAEISGIGGVEFICGDAAESAKLLLARGDRPDVVILDPPRAGCDEPLINTVCDMAPGRVVYISCDVATQARDIKLFGSRGYTLERVAGVDMFPRTAHVETVALLTRDSADAKEKV